MPRVGFEPTILAFERAKRVHALDRAATVTGDVKFGPSKWKMKICSESLKKDIKENLLPK
jgi:hypothetical protein